jgi:small subunit ribosomal protein S3
MGQKIHPYGLRLGIITDWKSRWYSEKDYAAQVNEDHKIRKYLRDELTRGAVSRIDIERLGDKKVQIDIHTGRPGVVIGRGGSEADRLRSGLEELSGRQVKFNVIEVQNPELDATLLARSVADQLEGRVAFRRAMKRAVSTALKAGAEGVRIQASGRLGGADMGRREWYLEGRVPLHTLRADVDFGQATARTSVGAVGIKCWVYKGDLLATAALRSEKITAEARLAAGGPSQRRRSARSRAEAAAGGDGERRLIEAGGGKRTVEAGGEKGGKRLIEAGGGKRKATAADAVAEFEAAREEAEEVVEALAVEEAESRKSQDASPEAEAKEAESRKSQDASPETDVIEAADDVVATESLPDTLPAEDVVAAEGMPEAAEGTASEEVVATESLPDASPTEDAVTSEASAEEAEDMAAKDMAAKETAPAQVEEGVWRPVEDENPPAGFDIKGKEGSMLFHRPDSSMYGRTKAEIWFNSEAAAEAAGFTAAKTHPKESPESRDASREQDVPDESTDTSEESTEDGLESGDSRLATHEAAEGGES